MQLRSILTGSLAFSLLVSAGSSCKKISNQPSGPTVYVAGYFTDEGAYNAVYWKNGSFTILRNDALATGMYVSGSDVYVSGIVFNNEQTPGVINTSAVYWKNGVEINLTDTATMSFAAANSIFVDGNDVYVAGYALLHTGIGISVYWKNGVAVNLSPLAPPFPAPPTPPLKSLGPYDLGDYAKASSIYVLGADIYVAGILNYFKPTYWKNGTPVTLADTFLVGSANSVFVSGNNVFVAGSLGNSAVYWKNGAITYLQETSPAQAYGIVVEGQDVYVAGGEGGISKYWKNGAPITLLSPNAWASSIFLYSNDVYVCGGIYGVPKYWKNGVVTNLPVASPGVANATSIYVQ